MTKRFTVTETTETTRLDAYISARSGLSRSRVQRLIRSGNVTVNEQSPKARYRVREGDVIDLTIPPEAKDRLVPENLSLQILWEDDHIIVINKPPGMVMYPAAGNPSGTVMNALVWQCKKLSSVGAPLRPGVVHRLDKGTSGALVVAKTDAAYYNLIRQFRNREVAKQYDVLLYGRLTSDEGTISRPIGRSRSNRKKMSTRSTRGKEAVTTFTVLTRFTQATLARVRILTGRTHQIRVHFASLGHPVLGDRTYGKKTGMKAGSQLLSFSRQMLHARSLKLRHPHRGEEMEFLAPLPGDMKEVIEQLRLCEEKEQVCLRTVRDA